jgi:hypothetical protein
VKDYPPDVRVVISKLATAYAPARTRPDGSLAWDALKKDVRGGLGAGVHDEDYPDAFAHAVGFGLDAVVDYGMGEWERSTRGAWKRKGATHTQGDLFSAMQPDGEWERKWWPKVTFADLKLTVPHIRAETGGHVKKLAKVEAAIAAFEAYGLPPTATIEDLEARKAAGPPPALTADDAVNL